MVWYGLYEECSGDDVDVCGVNDRRDCGVATDLPIGLCVDRSTRLTGQPNKKACLVSHLLPSRLASPRSDIVPSASAAAAGPTQFVVRAAPPVAIVELDYRASLPICTSYPTTLTHLTPSASPLRNHQAAAPFRLVPAPLLHTHICLLPQCHDTRPLETRHLPLRLYLSHVFPSPT